MPCFNVAKEPNGGSTLMEGSITRLLPNKLVNSLKGGVRNGYRVHM